MPAFAFDEPVHPPSGEVEDIAAQVDASTPDPPSPPISRSCTPPQRYPIGDYDLQLHRFDIKMRREKEKLEQFLNGLEREVVSITPNVAVAFMSVPRVDFLLIVERLR